MSDQKKVLIVDDDAQIVQALSIRLRAAGFEVVEAHDGIEGLDVARLQNPSAILLDLTLPKMDGLAVLSKLKDGFSTRDISIVVISARESDRRKSLDGGADYFISKPYDPVILVSALQAALAKNDERRASEASAVQSVVHSSGVSFA